MSAPTHAELCRLTIEERLELAAQLLAVSSAVLILEGPIYPMPTVHISRRVVYIEDALAALGVEEAQDRPGQIQIIPEGDSHG